MHWIRKGQNPDIYNRRTFYRTWTLHTCFDFVIKSQSKPELENSLFAEKKFRKIYIYILKCNKTSINQTVYEFLIYK